MKRTLALAFLLSAIATTTAAPKTKIILMAGGQGHGLDSHEWNTAAALIEEYLEKAYPNVDCVPYFHRQWPSDLSELADSTAIVVIDSGGGGPASIDLAGVARIFDQNRNAKTKFYIRGNDKTPDESRTIAPSVPQVIIGNWSAPQEVSLPPLARIPHLREAVHGQSVARLEDDVRQAEKTIAAADKYLAETRQRLAAHSEDDNQPTDGMIVVDAFDEPHDYWRLGRGSWDFSDGHVV